MLRKYNKYHRFSFMLLSKKTEVWLRNIVKLDQLKKYSVLYVALIFIAGASIWNVGVFLKWDKQNNQPIEPKKMVEMGLKLAFFPVEIQEKYNNYLKDDILTENEYSVIQHDMENHNIKIDQMIAEKSKFPEGKKSMTPLQYAEENLKAFEEYGRQILVDSEYEKVHKIMEDKITQEKFNEKTDKNLNNQ